MEQNKNFNEKYLEHLEQQIVETRNENFELRQKIIKLNDINADLRGQINTVSEKNRKLAHYGQSFGAIGNTIAKLHGQYQRALHQQTANDEEQKEA